PGPPRPPRPARGLVRRDPPPADQEPQDRAPAAAAPAHPRLTSALNDFEWWAVGRLQAPVHGALRRGVGRAFVPGPLHLARHRHDQGPLGGQALAVDGGEIWGPPGGWRSPALGEATVEDERPHEAAEGGGVGDGTGDVPRDPLGLEVVADRGEIVDV